jgi:signal transduction histidine kinase
MTLPRRALHRLAASPHLAPSTASDLQQAEIARLTLERDAARQALALASEERTRLVANLSHELRTPLNAIVGFSDLMRCGALGRIQPAIYQDYIDAMHQAGCHLVELLDAVLDMARIGAHEMPVHESWLVPADLLGDVAAMLRGGARRRGMRLICRVSDRSQLFADERMVRQMLINLVSNAIKFAPASSSISLLGRSDPSGGYRIEVRDQGAGLSAAQIDDIMHPFRQLANADAAAPEGAASSQGSGFGQGTGLGLPLVRALVELHDGTLQLHSRSGKGTSAVLLFPSARVRGPAAQTPLQREFSFSRSAALR